MLDVVGSDGTRLFDPISFEADGLTMEAHIRKVLNIVRTHLDMDVGFVSEFVDGKSGVPACRWRTAAPVKVGGSDPLEESYCQRVVDGRLPQLMRMPPPTPRRLG